MKEFISNRWALEWNSNSGGFTLAIGVPDKPHLCLAIKALQAIDVAVTWFLIA